MARSGDLGRDLQGKHARHAKSADDIQQAVTPDQAPTSALDAHASDAEPTVVMQPAVQPAVNL